MEENDGDGKVEKGLDPVSSDAVVFDLDRETVSSQMFGEHSQEKLLFDVKKHTVPGKDSQEKCIPEKCVMGNTEELDHKIQSRKIKPEWMETPGIGLDTTAEVSSQGTCHSKESETWMKQCIGSSTGEGNGTVNHTERNSEIQVTASDSNASRQVPEIHEGAEASINNDDLTQSSGDTVTDLYSGIPSKDYCIPTLTAEQVLDSLSVSQSSTAVQTMDDDTGVSEHNSRKHQSRDMKLHCKLLDFEESKINRDMFQMGEIEEPQLYINHCAEAMADKSQRYLKPSVEDTFSQKRKDISVEGPGLLEHDGVAIHSSGLEEHVYLTMEGIGDEKDDLPVDVDNTSPREKDDVSSVPDDTDFVDHQRDMDLLLRGEHPPPVMPSTGRTAGIIQTSSSNSELLEMVGMLKKSVSRFHKPTLKSEEDGGSVFDQLPPEVLIKIFSYLTVQEICLYVSPVCREWRLLSHDPSLWKSISFYHKPNLETMKLIWCLGRAPHLRKLVLCGRSNLTISEAEIITESCPMLQDVNLGFCDDVDCFILKVLVKNCPDLRVLNVEGCLNIDSNCVKLIAQLPKITDLNFSHCLLMEEDLVHLAKNVKQLKALNIDGISCITDPGILCLTEEHKEHLVRLEIDGGDLMDVSVLHIANCIHLTHLAISFCETFSDAALLALKGLTSLQHLKLRKGADFTEKGFMETFVPGCFPKLRHLDLSECSQINDAVVLQVVQCCGKNLTYLALHWCWNITDTGLISIVDHCRQVEELHLLGIDKILGECLDRVPEEIPSLKFIDLRQCNKIVDSLIVDMIRRKPDLHVINYYGEEFLSASS